MWIVIAKALLVVVGLPVLIALWLKKADELKTSAPGGSPPRPAQWWTYGNWAFWASVIAVVAAAGLEALTYRQDRPREADEAQLALLPLTAYEQEMELLEKKPPDWPVRKQELVRKFQFAEYAYSKHDYAKAVQTLRDLAAGQDSMGELLKMDSYVVNNNLGCALFRLQRNRGFLAAQALLAAKNRVPPGRPESRSIEDNLRTLDDLVNRLD
jgi:hypothetical protein